MTSSVLTVEAWPLNVSSGERKDVSSVWRFGRTGHKCNSSPLKTRVKAKTHKHLNSCLLHLTGGAVFLVLSLTLHVLQIQDKVQALMGLTHYTSRAKQMEMVWWRWTLFWLLLYIIVCFYLYIYTCVCIYTHIHTHTLHFTVMQLLKPGKASLIHGLTHRDTE